MNESWPQQEPQEESPKIEEKKSSKKNWLKRTAVATSFLIGGMMANQEAHSQVQNGDWLKAGKGKVENNHPASTEFNKLYVQANWDKERSVFISKVKFEKNVKAGEEIKFEYTLLDSDEKEIEIVEQFVGQVENPDQVEVTLRKIMSQRPTGYYFKVYTRNGPNGEWKPTTNKKVFHIVL